MFLYGLLDGLGLLRFQTRVPGLQVRSFWCSDELRATVEAKISSHFFFFLAVADRLQND